MELWGIDASPAFTRADGKHSTISRTLQSRAGAIDGGGAAGYNEKTQKTGACAAEYPLPGGCVPEKN